MIRFLGTALAAVALLVCGFFIRDGLQWAGIIEPKEDKPAAGMPRPGGGGAPGGYPAGDAAAVSVEIAPATLRTVRERVRGSGILEPAREVVIHARVEGEVEELPFEEGREVEAGVSLCSIDEAPLRLAEEIARIERDQSVRNFERLEELLASRSVTPQEVEEARFAKERAEAAHARAALDLEHARPAAPFAGTIVDRAIELGETVRVGDPLFTIADFRPLRVRLFLPESVVDPIHVGQIAELRSSRGGAVLTRGTVERVSPVVDRTSLTVEVLVHFEFAAGSVRPGSFAHVDIITRTEEDVVLVPTRALLRDGGETILYQIDGERAHRTVVLTGYEDESVVQIREGVAPGAKVVVEGARELSDNAAVQIYREVDPPVETVTVEATGRDG